MAQDNSDFPLAENLLDHPGSNPSLLTEDLIMDFSIDPDLCDSPIDRPPSSTFTSFSFISETSSALVSESNLSLPSSSNSALVSESSLPLPSSPKTKKQTGLSDFFSKIPSEEFHTKWKKRKRENAEKDQEEYEERKQKDEAHKLRKKADRRKKNRISQGKHRERLRKEKDVVRLEDPVSFFCCTP